MSSHPVVRPGIDGDGPALVLSENRSELVRRLARCGRIAWVSTWPVTQTAGLEARLRLHTEPLRVPRPRPALDTSDAATPKLRPVTRWLARMDDAGNADRNGLVWIDDVLGPDAQAWAAEQAEPVLLIKPLAAIGLTAEHVESVERFGRT